MSKHISTKNGYLLLLLLILGWVSSSYSSGSSSSGQIFGFNIHHRFSDPVKSIFPVDDFPEKDTVEYFAALAHHDRIHSRRLASDDDNQTPLTSIAGNETYRLSLFGYLYYANVSVGTPGLDFLVALDTGSDLFWLPCDCRSCVKGISTSGGQIDFNIYNLNTSSTGSRIPCSSNMCPYNSCSSTPSMCPYQISYLSSNTSSTGYLVEDLLHLTTDVNPSKPVNAKVAFGCGMLQTGSFLNGAAPNGLLGLGMNNMSVPTILANQKIAANSFSMCFASDGIGRISFGDQGSSDQNETPLAQKQSRPTFDVTLTQISVGTNVTNVQADVIFDSGTSFTTLTAPAYSFISENFNSQVKEKRVATDPNSTFEFCYELSSCQSDIDPPSINLTMKGGSQYQLMHPIVIVQSQSQAQCVYCLALVKSDHEISIVGQNFMTGYRIVFNQQKMVLGWQQSDCNYVVDSSTPSVSPESARTVPSTLDPEAAAGPTTATQSPGVSSTMGHHHSPLLNLFCSLVVLTLVQSLAIL